MNIQAVNKCCPKPHFTRNKDGYENPINRKTEKGLTVLGSLGVGTVLGATAADSQPVLLRIPRNTDIPKQDLSVLQ